jgi:acetyl esterase/lipase
VQELNCAVRCAVRWLRANASKYKINPEKFAAIGGSAGGHLAMMVGYSAEAPELKGDGGKSFADAPDLCRRASPITIINKSAPPTLILRGTIDTDVRIEQSDKLAAKLKSLGVPYTYDRLEGWPHSMDPAAVVSERCQFFADQFLAKYLPLPKGVDSR